MDRIEEIRARLDAANNQRDYEGTTMTMFRDEATLAVHAKSDIAWLLDEVDRLQTQLAWERWVARGGGPDA